MNGVSSRKQVLLLSAGHACVDVYQGSVTALVPFFVAERHYTYAAASGIVLAASLLSSVAQPLFGALTDRWPMPWLLPLSTFLGGAGIALSGPAATTRSRWCSWRSPGSGSPRTTPSRPGSPARPGGGATRR